MQPVHVVNNFLFHLILKDSIQDTAVFVIEIAVQNSSVVIDLLFGLCDLTVTLKLLFAYHFAMMHPTLAMTPSAHIDR